MSPIEPGQIALFRYLLFIFEMVESIALALLAYAARRFPVLLSLKK
jgi:hypothetical protein